MKSSNFPDVATTNSTLWQWKGKLDELVPATVASYNNFLANMSNETYAILKSNLETDYLYTENAFITHLGILKNFYS